MKIESLHNHTNASDGKQTHLEVLQTAQTLNYGVVAFTDHDVLPKPEAIEQLKQDYAGPVRWITGIEISAGAPKEVIEDPSTVHILGLFIDPTNQELLNYCQTLESSRLERMQYFVRHLARLGFTITEDDCLREAGESPVGSPHIVSAIQSHPQNQAVTDRLLAEMAAAAERSPEVRLRYQYMLSEGPRQYPYVLYMKHDSFISMPKPPSYDSLLDFDQTVNLIRKSGGVAILAHWFFNKDAISVELLEQLVQQKRIDGLETEVVNLITKHDISKDSITLRELVQRYGILETIGSDSHDVGDMKQYAKSQAAQRSINLTDHLIQTVNPSLTWTNFDATL